MLSHIQRCMLLFWLAIASWLIPVSAEHQISTSALLTCQSNSLFSAQQFDVVFYPDEKKADVNAQITSAIDGNFTVDAVLYVYGIKILTKTIKGCDLSHTVCPISAGRFTINSTFDINSDITKRIPGVAYTVPDIDALVRATVYYADDTGNKVGQPIACVEARLTNSKTVQHQYVSWILFAVIAVGVVTAGIATLLSRISTAAHIISNVISLFGYFQGVAVISMMGVSRMPPIAAAWAQNFVWTMGLISVGFMQKAATWYVRSTGGTPTNVLPNKDIISVAVYKRTASKLLETGLDLVGQPFEGIEQFSLSEQLSPFALTRRLDLSSNTTTTNERNISLDRTLVLHGIKRVSFLANIELSNLFVTGAAFFLFIGLALVLILAAVKGILELCLLADLVAAHRFDSYRNQWRSYTKGVLFRYFLVGFTQLSVLSLWEFTDRVSVGTTVDAVVIYAVLLVSLIYASVKVILLARNSRRIFQNPAYILYGNSEILNRWGFLYVQYRADAYWFLAPLLFFNFAKSAIIALGQDNGKVQCVMILVFDVLFLILVAWKRPWMDKPTNGFNIAIAAISMVNSIFFLFFSQIFGEKADVAGSIVGVVFFVVNAAFSLILLIMVVFACIWALLHPNPDARYEPVNDDRHIFMPEDGDGEKRATELDDLGDVARDGHRESYLNYDYNPAKSQGFSGAVENEHLNDHVPVMPQARPHSGYGDDFLGGPSSYRDFQSTGVLGRELGDASAENLVSHSRDHSDEHLPSNPFAYQGYTSGNYGQRRPSGPRDFPSH